MRTTTRRFVLLTTLCVLSASLASSAHAATATVTPGGATTASVSGTSSVWFTHDGAALLGCTAVSATATWASAAGVFPLAIFSDLLLGASGCRVAGISFTMSCGLSLIAGAVVGVTTGGLATPLILSGIDCALRLATGCSAVMEGISGADGWISAIFDSAAHLLTMSAPTASNQSLTMSGSTCTSVVPNGSVKWSGPSNGSLNFAVSPTTSLSVS